MSFQILLMFANGYHTGWSCDLYKYALIDFRIPQVFLTQVYSGTGDAQHLSPFLIPQYALMFVSMTALSAYSLQLLF